MQTKVTVRHYTDNAFGSPIGRFEVLSKPPGQAHNNTVLLTADDSTYSARLTEDKLIELNVPKHAVCGLARMLKCINPGVVTFTINS